MSRNWAFCASTVKIAVFAGLIGVIPPAGCRRFDASNVQQGKNSPTINTPSETVRVDRQENTSTIDRQSENLQATTTNSPNTPDRFGLQEGMPYSEARELLMQKDWQPNLLGDAPNLNDNSVKELFDLGYKEVKDCSGTGLGPCRFEFTNQAGELLVVSAITAGSSNGERQVWRWFIEKRTNANQQNSFAQNDETELPFVGTRFFNFLGGSGTGESITIEVDRTTTVKLHGTVSSSVEYSGKFSNPIVFPNGRGLLLKENKIYSLSVDGQIAKDCKGEGTVCESELYEQSSPAIANGLYVMGGTDQGLEVAGEQYRYYDEGGEKEWRPISELTYIGDGTVFDGKNYWCIPPKREPGVCSENGWIPVK